MADDNNSRYRRSDAFSQDSPLPGGQRSDPLAELARMIGQRDPFSEYSREYRASRSSSPHADPVPGFDTDPAWRFEQGPALKEAEEVSLGYGDETRPQSGADNRLAADWPDTPAAPQPYSADPLAPSPGCQPPASEFRDDHRLDADAPYRPDVDNRHSDRLGFESVAYQPMPDDGDGRPHLYPPEAADAMPLAHELTHEEEFYGDAPRNHRRKGLLTVVAVFGLAIIGTAGAFGYRSFFHGAKSSSPPPVIRASSEPVKVAPPSSNADSTANKFSYDRFGDRDQNERLVERQEAPVDAKDIVRTNVPRAVLLGDPISGPPLSQGATAAPTNPPSALGEPRRVRTVPIRPDRVDQAAGPEALASQPTPAQAAPVPARRPTNIAAGAAANAPLQVAPEPIEAASQPAAPRANSNPTAARSAARANSSPEPRTNAPLSLSPDHVTPSANSRASALAAPPRAAPTPTRLASAPAAGGGYFVQVASRRSEAEAESSLRSIQGRYANLLSGHQHVIKRVDLGGRGVYYRAMVGPFGSRNEAAQFCGGLKAAGGDCIVQSN
jgi:cell division protein FtsN